MLVLGADMMRLNTRGLMLILGLSCLVVRYLSWGQGRAFCEWRGFSLEWDVGSCKKTRMKCGIETGVLQAKQNVCQRVPPCCALCSITRVMTGG